QLLEEPGGLERAGLDIQVPELDPDGLVGDRRGQPEGSFESTLLADRRHEGLPPDPVRLGLLSWLQVVDHDACVHGFLPFCRPTRSLEQSQPAGSITLHSGGLTNEKVMACRGPVEGYEGEDSRRSRSWIVRSMPRWRRAYVRTSYTGPSSISRQTADMSASILLGDMPTRLLLIDDE